MAVLIEQQNMEAHSTGFSVLPLAGQYANDARRQDTHVSILFTVHLHLTTGTYRSLTAKQNDSVEGLKGLW